MVEPLYCRHHWDRSKDPDYRGVVISKAVLCYIQDILQKCPDDRSRAEFRILWKGGQICEIKGRRSRQTVSVTAQTHTARGFRGMPPEKIYIFRGPELTLDAFSFLRELYI